MPDDQPAESLSWSEQRDAAQNRMRLELSRLGFDGPVRIPGDAMAMAFGAEAAYAVCLGCGAPVFLNDAEILRYDEGQPQPTERGIRLHRDFHQRIGDPLPTGPTTKDGQ